MRKAISIEALQQALTNQRACMLALANTDLTEYQATALNLLYVENEILVNLFGIEIPTLQSIIKSHNEIAYLEQLYQNSNEKRREITEIDETVETKQKEIHGISRMGHATIRNTKTL